MKKPINFIRTIYFFKFFADALVSGYLSMYFLTFFDKYSYQYGVLLGVIPFCALIGNFIWGALSKDVKRNLLLIKIIGSLELLSLLFFIGLGRNFITLLIFTIAISLFNSPVFSFQDGLSSAYAKKDNISFTSVRIMGSLGYLFALASGAGLIYLFKENFLLIFIISSVIYLMCIILWFFIKPFDNTIDSKETKIKFSQVLSNKIFLLYFIAYILIISMNNVGDSFLFARLSDKGLSSSGYSLVFASEIFLEVITSFLIIKFVKEKHFLITLKLATIVIFLRLLLFSFNFPLGLLIAFAPLRGIGWGAFISLHIIVLRKIVSAPLLTKAITMLAIPVSLFNGLFTIFGPTIYQQCGLNIFYLILATICAVGVSLLLFLKPHYLKYK